MVLSVEELKAPVNKRNALGPRVSSDLRSWGGIDRCDVNALLPGFTESQNGLGWQGPLEAI